MTKVIDVLKKLLTFLNLNNRKKATARKNRP